MKTIIKIRLLSPFINKSSFILVAIIFIISATKTFSQNDDTTRNVHKIEDSGYKPYFNHFLVSVSFGRYSDILNKDNNTALKDIGNFSLEFFLDKNKFWSLEFGYYRWKESYSQNYIRGRIDYSCVVKYNFRYFGSLLCPSVFFGGLPLPILCYDYGMNIDFHIYKGLILRMGASQQKASFSLSDTSSDDFDIFIYNLGLGYQFDF